MQKALQWSLFYTFLFFSTANLDGLVKVVSLFFVIVALGVCVTNIGLINMSCAFMPCPLKVSNNGKFKRAF